MKAPPGAFLLVVAYGAGLVTGLSRFLDPVIAIPLLVAAVWVSRASVRAVVAGAAALGVAVGAVTGSASRSSCVAQLPLGDRVVRLRTIDPASPSGRVTLIGGQCRAVLPARWTTTQSIGAGHDVTARTRWVPRPARLGRPGGMLLVSRVDRVAGVPGPLDSLRSTLASASSALYGSRAPMVDAIIMGRRGALDRDVVAQFAAAGLVHLLAISGLHIGVIAGWVLLILSALPLGRHAREGLAVAAAIGYTLFIGSPPSAERASALMALLAWCRWRQRHVGPMALFAASALLVLCFDPFAIGEIGAWLSVLALAGVAAATRWSARAVGRAAMVRAISGSIGATLATAPLTALVFGQVAPIGILLNLVAVPLTALAVPVLLLSLLAWPVATPVAVAFATSGGWLLQALGAVARFGAAAPGAAQHGAPGWESALPWLLAAVLACWLVFARVTMPEAIRRAGWGAVAVVWSLLALPAGGVPRLGNGRLALLFVDVGQGDAALIRTPLGHWLAIDAGPVGRQSGDAGSRVLLPLLAREHVTQLTGLVLSHAHRDHVGGAASLVNRLPVAAALDPGELFADSAYDAWLTALSAHGVRWRPARAGLTWEVDGVQFRVLHPPRAWSRQGDDLNEDSLVLELRYGAFAALFMGDAGFVAESAMGSALPRADVLKVGHHGSRWATSEMMLGAVRPEVGIISVGRNNYGHPASATLARLARAGVRVWRTDQEGTTTVETDGVTFAVHGGRTSATFAARARAGPRRRRARPNQGHHAGAIHPESGTGAPRRDR
ncbi:MAG: DNA internalization-related competence protein ComEC/Rec2 [Gemmatimonadota bacterium]